MRGKDNGLAFTHAADQSANFVFLIWIKPIGRLVQDEDVRVVDNSLGKAGPMAITLGERINALMENRFEVAHFDNAVDGLLPRIAGQSAQLGAEKEETS